MHAGRNEGIMLREGHVATRTDPDIHTRLIRLKICFVNPRHFSDVKIPYLPHA